MAERIITPTELTKTPIFHPLLEIFPEMEPAAFHEFVADIKANGVREPVWMYKGQLLDGRNRWLACEELGIQCPTREYTGDEKGVLAFVLSQNLHLDASQRAMIAGEIANIRHGGDRKSDQAGKLQVDSVSRTDAAKMLNVSPEIVTMAKKVIANGTPDVVKAVKQGKLSVSSAAKLVGPNPNPKVVMMVEHMPATDPKVRMNAPDYAPTVRQMAKPPRTAEDEIKPRVRLASLYVSKKFKPNTWHMLSRFAKDICAGIDLAQQRGLKLTGRVRDGVLEVLVECTEEEAAKLRAVLCRNDLVN